VPRWGMESDARNPWSKRLVWSARDWVLSAAGRGERLEYLAKRQAFLDFLLGRLGPTPALVLDLNKRWSLRRGSSSPAAAV
jgi:hypothetical protein